MLCTNMWDEIKGRRGVQDFYIFLLILFLYKNTISDIYAINFVCYYDTLFKEGNKFIKSV